MCELNVQQALSHLGGSTSLYRTLVEGFCEKYSKVDLEIDKALKNQNLDEARRLAHSMKGLSGNLGAITLQKKAKALEYGIKEILNEDNESLTFSDMIIELKASFSEELAITLRWLNCLLQMKDEKMTTIQSVEDIECYRHGTDDCIKGLVKTLIGDKLENKLNHLIGALGSYNYELINNALQDINEDAIKGVNPQKWAEIKRYIDDYEYDKAKQILLEGLENER